jgi:hypothetical protein
VSVLSPTRRATESFDHPGLFTIQLRRSSTVAAATKTLESPAMRPKRAWLGRTDRPKSGLRRYCSGCAHETEHVAWTADGLGSIPAIRWPTAVPATGTTTCLNCGQWRAASSQPLPPGWSCWPRSRIATRRLAVAVESADTADDWVSEAAAENEGMPPRREPRPLRRSSLRLRHGRSVARLVRN